MSLHMRMASRLGRRGLRYEFYLTELLIAIGEVLFEESWGYRN
jgi:hypothetical protein